MGFENLWPFFLAVFIPGIILLYLLKQKVVQKTVSAINLWKEAYEQMQASTPWEKFRNQILMYLQIAAIIFFIFALAGPYIATNGVVSDNLVLFLDASGSMKAEYEDGQTRFECAVAKAVSLVKEADEACHISVVTASDAGHLEISSSADKKRIINTLKNLTPTDCDGSLEQGKSLVQSMVSAFDDYQVVGFTDSDFSMEDLHGNVVDLSSTGKNLAVEYLSHSRQKDGTVLVMAQIKNSGNGTVDTNVSLYIGDELYDVQSLKLERGKSQTVYFKEVTAARYESGCKAGLYFKAESSAKDLLKEDNVAFERLQESGNKRVLLVTKQNTFLEKALECNGNITLDKTDSIQVTKTEKNEEYDLIVYDGMLPGKIEDGGNYIFVNPANDIYTDGKKGELIARCGDKMENSLIAMSEHVVTDYLDDFEFGCNEVYSFDKPEWAETFFTSGKKCVGFLGSRNGGKIAALGFDLHDTDFVLQTEFPIFIYQLVDNILESGMISQTALSPGMTAEIRQQGSAKQAKIELFDSDGTKSSDSFSLKNGYVGYTDTKQSGLYKVTQDGLSDYFVVRFPAMQSAMDKKAVITGAGTDGKNAAGKGVAKGIGTRLKTPAIIILLLIVIIEGIVYIKKSGRRLLKSKPSIPIIRGILLLFIVLALFGISVSRATDRATTIFLVDASESFSGNRSDMVKNVKKALTQLPEGEQAGIIAFGQEALVEQFIADKPVFSNIETTPVGTATNIEKAIQAAMALFPEDNAPRLVLLTDGKENEGNMEQMASALVSAGVDVSVMQSDSLVGDEVYLSGISIPEKINVGDHFQVKVEVESTVDTPAVLQLYAGEDLKQQKEIEVKKGSNSFMFSDTNKKEGFSSYRAVIKPQSDTVSVNNEYVAFTEAETGKKVLLIEGSDGESKEFRKVLKAANIDFDVVISELAPDSIVRMNRYKTIIMQNVSETKLPEKFLKYIGSYVKDYGGGFIAIGGNHSFAPGGYKDTELEKVLPVDMDLTSKKKIPEMSMVMAIDHSGSMSDLGGNSKLALAKDAAVTAVDNMREDDHVGVLVFDDKYTWSVPLTGLDDKSSVRQKINGISDGGGTSIYPALRESYRKIKDESTEIKHIVLLTDGQDGFTSGYPDLLDKIVKDNITVSTVAVGDDAENKLLEKIAEIGGGRFYQAKQSVDLPNIFAQEVFLAQKAYLVNRNFTPMLASASRLFDSSVVEKLPVFGGYVATSLKDKASAAFVSDEDDDPILAYWQYGLGRSVAFTSDVTNEWTANCAGWDSYPEFWKQIIGYTMDEAFDSESTAIAVQTGVGAKVTYTTKDTKNADSVMATYSDLDGKSHDVELKAVTPGTYEGEITVSEPGIYGVHVTREKDGKIVDSKNTQLSLQYSKEFRFQDKADTLDSFVEKCQGRYIDTLDGVFKLPLNIQNAPMDLTVPFLVIAFILLLIDILNRKFMIPWKKLIPHNLSVGRKVKHADVKGKKFSNSETASDGQINGSNVQTEHVQADMKDSGVENKNNISGTDTKKGVKKEKKRKKKEKNQPDILDVSALKRDRKF